MVEMSEENLKKEEEEEKVKETFNCPSCGEPQSEFLYHKSRYGWVKCPSCGKYVRRKGIPDKFIRDVELEEIEPEKVEKKPEWEEEEGGKIPFRRPRPPHVILESILEEFGVKSPAIKIIVTRCERLGELHPTEVQRMLLDLDSGLKSREASYVADEYYFALQKEHEVEEYGGRTVYPKFGGEGEYGTAYGWGRREYGGTQYTPSTSLYPKRSWEEPSGAGTLTEQRLMEILERRDRDFQERFRREKMEDTLTELMKQVINLSNEIKNLKENPPSSIPSDVVTKADLEKREADSYMRMLERQVDTLEKAVDKYENLIKESEEKHRTQLKEIQQGYKDDLKELRRELDEARKHSERTSEGYKEDAYRFAAEGMHRVADILEKKEPIKIAVETWKTTQEGQKIPPKEKVGEEEITSQIPEEYLEE